MKADRQSLLAFYFAIKKLTKGLDASLRHLLKFLINYIKRFTSASIFAKFKEARYMRWRA